MQERLPAATPGSAVKMWHSARCPGQVPIHEGSSFREEKGKATREGVAEGTYTVAVRVSMISSCSLGSLR